MRVDGYAVVGQDWDALRYATMTDGGRYLIKLVPTLQEAKKLKEKTINKFKECLILDSVFVLPAKNGLWNAKII